MQYEYVIFAVCSNGHRYRLRLGVNGPCVNLGPDGKWTVRCPKCNTTGWSVGLRHKDYARGYIEGDVEVLSAPLQSRANRKRRTEGVSES